VEAGLGWLAVVMVLASVISVYYYLKVTVAMYMWEAPAAARLRADPLLVAALVVALVGVFEMGIFPGPLIELASRSVAGVFGGVGTALP
jgi:NADH-quinone oxidoreductase subunit N